MAGWPFASVAAPTFDTGPGAAVPTSAGSLTASVVWLLGAAFTNTNAAQRTVTLTDAAGAVVDEFVIPGGASPDPKEYPFRPLTGLKWLADGAGVIGQVWGYV
jgi:hypothetical protein